MRKTLKNIFINLSVLVVTLLVLFVLVEIGFRVFWHNSDRFYQSDPYIGQIHIPNKTGMKYAKEYEIEVKINRHGFVGRDYDYAKPAGAWRALMLGDSFVEGLQVPAEDNFTSLTEQALNKELEGNYQVINMGVSNFGTIRSYLNLKHYGLKYNPDLAILAFFAGNDITDNYMEQEEVVIDDGQEAMNWKQYIKSWLLNNLHSAQYAREKSFTSVPLRRFFIKLGLLDEQKELANTGEGQGDVPYKYHIYLSKETELFKEAWGKTTEYLDKFNDLARQKGTDTLFVLLPTRDQVYPTDLEQVKQSFPVLEEKELDMDKPQKDLTAFLQSQGYNYLDLAPGFKELASASDERLYYRLDGHFAPAGHRLAAELISDYLVNDYFKKSSSTAGVLQQ